MDYGNDAVMLSDDIAEFVQVDYPKNSVLLKLDNDTFELEMLQYKKNNIKTIKAFGNINSILHLMNQETFAVQLIVNDECKSEFSKSDIEELQINNISTNCNIIIILKDLK